ncbi:MAG: hypothetical protein N2235_02950 [Fischerella sp.]|nr:hypothetical protein [Fischerella sp.]
MVINVVNISDLDCIYLSYDEPQKENFWLEIKNKIPWAKRVDGVKGSDTAHKAAAKLSETDRFILIDGDNIPDFEFFNLQLKLDEINNDFVFRWKARNIINGLIYGNGGISCWTKEFVLNMRTHENSDGKDENDIEYCFHPKYLAMHNCYSTTYINYTPFQAWRAGFREGVKLCLNKGKKIPLLNFEDEINLTNLEYLSIWHSVGLDIINGEWAILGARQGTYMTLLTDWNYKEVQSFDLLMKIWETHTKNKDNTTERIRLGEILKNRLGLKIADLDSEQSKFFKYFYSKQHKNLDIMAAYTEKNQNEKQTSNYFNSK